MNRTHILRGPAVASYNAVTIPFDGEARHEFAVEYDKRRSAAFGAVKRTLADAYTRTRFAPSQWDSLAVLYPYFTKMPGQRLCGAADLPLVITPRDGAPLTVHNAVISRLPNIRLAPIGSMLGDMEFSGYLAKDGDQEDQGDYFSFGNPATNAVLAGYNAAKIINARYSLTIGGGDPIEAEGPIDIEFDLSTTPIPPRESNYPTLDLEFVELVVRLAFTPLGMTEADYAALVGIGLGKGASAAGATVVVAGANAGEPQITLANMVLGPGEVGWGAVNRTGRLVLENERTVTTNALVAPVTFGTVAG